MLKFIDLSMRSLFQIQQAAISTFCVKENIMVYYCKCLHCTLPVIGIIATILSGCPY